MNKIEEYNKLNENHKRILYKRNKHKLMKGKCFYIIKHPEIDNKLKFGITIDLNSRYSQYQTYDITDFLYIVFTKDNKLLEECVAKRFEKNLKRYNSEWICDIELDDIINFIESISELLQIETNTYLNVNEIIIDNEEISEIDKEINKEKDKDTINEEEINNEKDDNTINEDEINNEQEEINNRINLCEDENKEELNQDDKKCNKCLIIMSKTNFNKDKTKKDGLHTVCRTCEKEI